MSPELNALTVAEASRLIHQRKLSPVELTDASLNLISRVDKHLVSFVTVTADRARQEAKLAESEIMSGGPKSPVHGIPYGLKDVFETAGVLTTAQSRLLANNIPQRDSFVQQRLRAAGGVLLGKTTTWEFAHGVAAWDGFAPPAHNPWRLDRHPGGSSSGSAVAVAAGLIPAAFGTDTGGSVRMPAAVCGIAGLKPTYGLVSRRGVLINSYTHDHVGPLAWTAEDLAILTQVIAGHDPEDPSSVNLPVPNLLEALNGRVDDLTIGIPARWLQDQLPPSPATNAAFDAALDVFKQLGAKTVDIELPPVEDFNDAKRIIAMADLFAVHGKNLRARAEMFGADLRYRIIAGSLIRAEDYIQAMRVRTVLSRAVQGAFTKVDLMMLPTAEPAGLLEPVPPQMFFLRSTYTCAFSVSGNPALSICNGFDKDGMPTSLQIVGRLFDDATVLRAGHAYESVTKWRNRRPAAALEASKA